MLPSTTFLSRFAMAQSMMVLRWHASEYFMLCCAWVWSICEGESLGSNGVPANFLSPSGPACYVLSLSGLACSVSAQVLCVVWPGLFPLSPRFCVCSTPAHDAAHPLDLLSSGP